MLCWVLRILRILWCWLDVYTHIHFQKLFQFAELAVHGITQSWVGWLLEQMSLPLPNGPLHCRSVITLPRVTALFVLMQIYSVFPSRKQHSSLTCPLCIKMLFISAVPQQLGVNFTSWFDACVCLSTLVPFNGLFVCVGVGHALAEFSIIQCCRLLEWIPFTLLMSSFYIFVISLIV